MNTSIYATLYDPFFVTLDFVLDVQWQLRVCWNAEWVSSIWYKTFVASLIRHLFSGIFRSLFRFTYEELCDEKNEKYYFYEKSSEKVLGQVCSIFCIIFTWKKDYWHMFMNLSFSIETCDVTSFLGFFCFGFMHDPFSNIC